MIHSLSLLLTQILWLSADVTTFRVYAGCDGLLKAIIVKNRGAIEMLPIENRDEFTIFFVPGSDLAYHDEVS